MKIHFYIILMSILLLKVTEVVAQNKIDSKVYSNIGYEYNPFNSPSTYFDKTKGITLTGRDLLKTDQFWEYGYDFSFEHSFNKKLSFELVSDWHNKRFFNEKILNNGLFNIGLNPSVRIKKWLIVGGGYAFDKQNMVHADILGEQTKYVLSYIQHSFTFFIKTKPWKNNITNFYYSFEKPQYSSSYSNYNGTSTLNEIDLDNTQHTLELRMIQDVSKRSKILLKIQAFDREYKYLPSYNSFSSPNYLNMRHYQHIEGKLSFNSELNNVIELQPFVGIARRTDMFNDYFSYLKKETGLAIDLKFRRVKLGFDFRYSLYDYDKCDAPKTTLPYPALKYKYYDGKISLTYIVANGFELIFSGYNDFRDSNSNLESWKYRRGYENFYIKSGICLYPDRWFEKKKRH